MKKSPVLAAIQRKKRQEKVLLWSVQAVIAVFRAVSRVFELIGPPKRRQRLRRLKERLDALEQDKRQILSQIKAGNVRGGLEAVDALRVRYAKPDEQEELQQQLAGPRKTWQESDALQAIALQAGKDKALAVEGYRKYVSENPDSASGFSYLGGFLKQIGDTGGSIAAHKEVLRLAGDNSLKGSMARLHIGEVYMSCGDIPSAIGEFQHIIDNAAPETRSTVCLVYLYLGDAYLASDDKPKAIEAWKQAIQWDSTQIMAKKAREKIKALL